MTEFKPAPEGQPTSNIELMLRYARSEYSRWETSHREAQLRLDSAEKMLNYWDDRERELEYQLEQRRLDG